MLKYQPHIPGKKLSPEHVAKLPQNRPGRKLTLEHRQKLMGRLTMGHRQKISAGSRHRIPAEWEIEALRQRRKGTIISEEVKDKIRKKLLLYQADKKLVYNADRELKIKNLKPGESISFFCPLGISVSTFRSEIAAVGGNFHSGKWRLYARSENVSPKNVRCFLITREEAEMDSRYSVVSKSSSILPLRRTLRAKLESYAAVEHAGKTYGDRELLGHITVG